MNHAGQLMAQFRDLLKHTLLALHSPALVDGSEGAILIAFAIVVVDR
jgi:hypothetical protein